MCMDMDLTFLYCGFSYPCPHFCFLGGQQRPRGHPGLLQVWPVPRKCTVRTGSPPACRLLSACRWLELRSIALRPSSSHHCAGISNFCKALGFAHDPHCCWSSHLAKSLSVRCARQRLWRKGHPALQPSGGFARVVFEELDEVQVVVVVVWSNRGHQIRH